MLTPEKAELIGALLGDKSLFGIYPRYGHYKGYDYSRYKQGITRISLGKDEEWGVHLSNLVLETYGIKGSVLHDNREHIFRIDSARVVKDLMRWFDPSWNCYNWQVHREVYSASDQVKIGLLRGYCDADGSPIFNRSRKQPLIKIESVNHDGLLDVNGIFHKLGYNSHVWRESKTRRTWGLYLTRLEDVRRFHQQIRFSITRKQSRLSDVISLKTSSRTVE